MTKIKNTKKGMAKKTLSISLVAAMLATSNVPVWATEFSDGSDVTFTSEAPVVEETAVPAAAAEEFTSEAPVVEEAAEEVTAQAAAEPTTNKDNKYTSTLTIKDTDKLAWGSKVELEGDIKEDGTSIIDNAQTKGLTIKYLWKAGEYQATESAGNNTYGEITANATADGQGKIISNLSTMSFTPQRADFNKTLTLEVEVYQDVELVFKQVIGGDVKVGPKNISTDIFGEDDANVKELVDVAYTGNAQKLIPKIEKTTGNEQDAKTEAVTFDFDGDGTLENVSDFVDWKYEQAENDFTGCTGDTNKIKVTGSLTNNEKTWGYTAGTVTKTYAITEREIKTGTKSKLEVELKTTSVEYTGKKQTFGKKDITLWAVIIDDNDTEIKRIDITDSLADDFSLESDATDLGKNYKLTGKTITGAAFAKVPENFKLADKTEGLVATDEIRTDLASNNAFAIIQRDLSKCTASLFVTSISKLDGNSKDKVTGEQIKTELEKPANDLFKQIKLTDSNGRTLTLDEIEGSINIEVQTALTNAVNDKKPVDRIEKALLIKANVQENETTNVIGSVYIPVRLTIEELPADFGLKAGAQGSSKPLAAAAKDVDVADNYSVTYNGKEQKIESTKGFEITGGTFDSGTYVLTYKNNKDAGIATVTFEGRGNYAGCNKDFYFRIKPDKIVTNNVTMKSSVTLDPGNTNISGYEDALGLTIKQNDATLKKGTDYDVTYYYAKVDKLATEDAIKSEENEGTNVVGNYIYAVIKGKGNYTTKKTDDNKTEEPVIKCAKIEEQKLSDVSVELEKDSYVYTGADIVPKVVVKNGKYELVAGKDYIIKTDNNKNVGTATITIEAQAGSGFKPGSSVTKTFTITPANAQDVTVILTGGTKAVAATDSGKEIENTFMYSKRGVQPEIKNVMLGNVDVTKQFAITTYGDNDTAGKEAGSVIVSPNADNKNFTGTKTHLFDIKGTALNGKLNVYNSAKKAYGIVTDTKTIARPDNGDAYYFYYNGDGCTFEDEAFTPAIANVTAKEGTDYEIKYINNVDAGWGFVAVIAKGNYEGNYNLPNGTKLLSGEGNYTVKDGQLKKGTKVLQNNIVDILAFGIHSTKFTKKNITVSNGVYASGLPVKPQVKVTVAGKTLTEGKDYKLDITGMNEEEFSYPDSVINATVDKPFVVEVVSIGGYEFDDVDGYARYAWGIDKFDLANADIQATKDQVVVKNGAIVVDPADYTVTEDKAAGTVTVAAKDGSKNYTGSKTVEVDMQIMAAPVIKKVEVTGNTAEVILAGTVDGAEGYDYVIATEEDYKNGRVDISKNQVATSTDFYYVQKGTYYAYCHAWKRDPETKKKVFGEWSKLKEFKVASTTPATPEITSVKVSGNTVTVTYKECENATGYDVVLGTQKKKVNGENRPVNYGTLVKKNIMKGTVTATFKNVPKGTFYAGLHAFNRTSMDGKKVFSKWSNVKKVTVK